MTGSISTISAIVPSLGHSPWQDEMLAALRRELAGFPGSELIWVHQGPHGGKGVGGSVPKPPHLPGARELLVRLPRAAGFAVAVNTGFAVADETAAIVLVNDDCVVEPGWLAALADELARRPQAGALQGAQLELARPEIVEGSGLGWNRWWQAVQVAAGEPAAALPVAPFELFGVSATAALYRREALAAVAGSAGRKAHLFDERLDSYYEDVELAVRLREAEWESWCVPAARARHAGQATAGRAPLRRWRSIHRNRLLVLRRLLGGEFVANLPRLAARDLRDLLGACLRLDGARALGVVAGWASAMPHLAAFAPPSASASRRARAAAARFRIGSTA